ncbi:hypothetical protein N4R57_02140 [Rhodobacteraceae bacterium D3-12]|nr:hypothetical protein N4R57_02140 [Rhodobacteraceae bacterium D3-12]
MRGREKKPLYRSVNTRTHGVRHGSGVKARWERNTKAAQGDAARGSMHSGQRHGRDYTPLFKFLLSRVGQDWAAVRREAIARLDREEPIGWMVAATEAEGERYFRAGESSYYSGLYVDNAGKLCVVDSGLTPETMRPFCGCCTHTLNGVRLSLAFDDADG